MTRSESLQCDDEFLHTTMQRRLYSAANRMLAKSGFFEAVVNAEEMLLDPADICRFAALRPTWLSIPVSSQVSDLRKIQWGD